MIKDDIEKMITHEVQLSLDQAHRRIIEWLQGDKLIKNQDCGLTDEVDLVDTRNVDSKCIDKIIDFYSKFITGE